MSEPSRRVVFWSVIATLLVAGAITQPAFQE